MAANLHRIMGSKFIHEKPNLCPLCQYRQDYGEWQGYCTAKQRIISAANRQKGRCGDYQEAKANGN